MQLVTRRKMMCGIAAAGAAAVCSRAWRAGAAEEGVRLHYLLASCLYGYAPLAEILPEVPKTGATAIDLWPQVHGNQREQLAEMGEEQFSRLAAAHGVRLGCITQYKLGPFGLQEEMRLAHRLGCRTIVTGAQGPKGLQGAALKAAVAEFVDRLRPHLSVAEETGVTIAIENHGDNLIESPDAIQWLVDLRPSPQLAIALAPYHLPQDEQLLAGLIRNLGDRIAVFYAWQYGMGCHQKLPKEQELLQMPGRGMLDFRPLLAALRSISYGGWTEIFMHPVPRGIPILEPAAAVTAEINRARQYLEASLA